MFLQAVHHAAGLVVGILSVFAAEFHQQPAAAVGQEFEIARMKTLDLHVFDEQGVDRLAGDRFELEDFGNVIASLINIGIAQNYKRAARRTPNQFYGCFQRHGAGAFSTYQRARHVESVFWQQVRQVVAGHAARNVRKPAADLVLHSARRFASAPCKFRRAGRRRQ